VELLRTWPDGNHMAVYVETTGFTDVGETLQRLDEASLADDDPATRTRVATVVRTAGVRFDDAVLTMPRQPTTGRLLALAGARLRLGGAVSALPRS